MQKRSFFKALSLYKVRYQVDRGNPFRRILKELCGEWRNLSPGFTSLPKRGIEDIKDFISSGEKNTTK